MSTRAQPRGVAESAAILERVVDELHLSTVADLDRAKVNVWRQERLARGASNKTVNNALAVLLAALALCVRLGQLEHHPLRAIRSLPVGARHQRRRPRALSEWEIVRLLAAADGLDGEHAAHAAATTTIDHATKGAGYARRERAPVIPQAIILRVLLETGARWGEATAATWADFDEPAGLLTFRAETTKTERERAVPLRAGLVEDLRRYRLLCGQALGELPPASTPILRAPRGGPCERGTANFRRFLLAAYERAGLLRRGKGGRLESADGHALNVHTLRHTCCTRLARAGAPLPVAQAMLGHASPAMTARVYSHFTAEGARAWVERVAVPDPERDRNSESTPLHRHAAIGRSGYVEAGEPPMVPGTGDERSLQRSRDLRRGADGP